MIVNKGHHAFMRMELEIVYAQGSHPSSAGHSLRLPLSSATHGGGASTIDSLPASATSPPLIANPSPAVSTASISGHSSGASEAGQPDEEAHTNSELTSQLYHDDRLMVGSMPSEWNDEALRMEIEDILGISENEYKLKSLDNGYLLVLSKHYTEQGTCMYMYV